MKQAVRVGIIGIGFMGSTHYDLYQANPRAEVIAIADIDPAKLQGNWSAIVSNISGQDYSQPVDLSSVRKYEDAARLIQDEQIDLVDICLPTYLHAKYTMAALRAGKHVLCEKPLARSRTEADEIVTLAEKSPGLFTVGMCVRYWPEYQYVKNLLESGELGTVRAASFRRISPNIDGNAWNNWFMDADKSGGAMLDLHIHDTDIVRYFFGRPSAVTSFGLTGFRTDRGVDHCISVYEYPDGLLVHAEGSWSPASTRPFEMGFLLVCDKATVEFRDNAVMVYYEDGRIEEPAIDKATYPTGWHRELDYILDCIQQGRRPEEVLPQSQLMDALCIVEAETASVHSGKKTPISYRNS